MIKEKIAYKMLINAEFINDCKVMNAGHNLLWSSLESFGIKKF